MNAPLELAVHDNVEEPDPPVIDVGVRVQVRPVNGAMVSVNATVPVKPFTGATVMVEVRATPVLPLTLVGLAPIVKSWTVNVTVAE